MAGLSFMQWSRVSWRVKALAATAWVVLVGVGYGVALHHETTAGPSPSAPLRWPADTPVRLDRERLTLLLFAHPKCPCTRATIAELARLVAACGDRLCCRVFFYSDPPLGSEFDHGEAWDDASRIPGVLVGSDPLASLALRFGVTTSGTVLVYDGAGALRFAGGITAGRGHQGDNAGVARIARLARGERIEADRTPVFGCPIVEADDEERTR
jgi:hypothetical protein